MKTERPEIEKTKLAGNIPLDPDVIDILKTVSGSVLDINGGVGRVSEYLSEKGCDVTLLDPNRLSFSYRRGIVPKSKVKCWNIEADAIKLDKPVFDYVIIRGLGYHDLAKKIAKKGIVNLITVELENVVHSPETVKQSPKTNGNIGADKESVANNILPSVPEAQSDTAGDASVKPMVDME